MASTQNNSRIGLIIVGDEILSGRRQDKHFSKVVELLSARGLQLSWVEILSDDRELLTSALKRSFASGDIVLTCGGIGATPDDHTRQAAGAALGLPLALHPEAAEQIRLRCVENAEKGQGTADMRTPENQQRLQMGMFPTGAEIVPNPFNRIPGFFIQNHTFVPGFPVMAWPMMEWVLDSYYAPLFHQSSSQERSVIVFGAMEAALTPLMQAIEADFDGVRIFSLPSVDHAQYGRHIELGVKGEPALAQAAFQALLSGLQAFDVKLGPELVR